MDLRSEIRSEIGRCWKAASRNIRLQTALAFFLPVLIFIIATRMKVDSSAAIAAVGANEAEAVKTISAMFSSGHVLSNISAVREILADHTDPLFLMALPAGCLSIKVFAASVLVRIGLCSTAMFLFLRRRVRTSAAASLMFALSYTLMPQALTYGVMPTIADLMIMLPVVMYAEDVYLCQTTRRNFLILTGVSCLMVLTGAYGILCGIPFALAAALIMTLCRTGRIRKILVSMGGIIPSQILAAGLTAIVQFPRFYNGEVSLKPENEKIAYTFFDQLTGMLYGRIPSSVTAGAPAYTTGILVLMLILLFFANRAIPFRVKAAVFLCIAAGHLSAAVPVVDSLVSVYGDRSFAACRLICLMVLLIFAAAVSIRNISFVSERAVCISEALILAVIVISNSSANEITPTEFTLFFSAAAAVVSGGMLLKGLRGNGTSIKVLFIIAFIAMSVNLYRITPDIITTADSLRGYDSGNVDVDTAGLIDKRIPAEDLPLYGDVEDSYLLVTADLSYLQPDSAPDALNCAARSALLRDVYGRADYNVIYNHGTSHYGTDLFTFDPSFGQSELIIGVDIGDADRCIVTSSLDSRVFLTESYIASDRVTTFDMPFIFEITPEDQAFSLRYATTVENVVNGSLSVWTIDRESLQILNDSIRTFDGSVIEDGDYNWLLSFTGPKSVITSIDYDPGIRATAGGRKADTYNYNGLLAVLFESDGSGIMPEIRLKSSKGDLLAGAMISVISAGCLLGLICIGHGKEGKKEKSVGKA